MNKQQLCRFLGISRSVVDRLIAEGLPAGGSATRPVFAPSDVAKWLLHRAEHGSKVLDFADQKERLTAAQAEKAELQVQALRGELVPADAVERAWSTTWSTVRDLFRAIPMSAVDRVMAAVEEGRPAVKLALQEEIDDALSRASSIEVVIETDEEDGDEAAA